MSTQIFMVGMAPNATYILRVCRKGAPDYPQYDHYPTLAQAVWAAKDHMYKN